ncbi:MAG: hypothetical protein ACI9VR_004650 [Cognaticolwellia sp.]|jgi:hypothetical protein
MGSVLALMVMIFVAYVIVVAGGTAYEMTGLDRDTSRFQALSAFTGTGFTTRESERVIRHPLRRQITIGLIIFGYAGTATVVATLVRSVDVDSAGQTALNVAVLIVVAVGSFLVVRRGLLRFLDAPLRRWIAQRFPHQAVHSHDDLLIVSPGYGISKVAINPRSGLAGLQLRKSGLRGKRLTVLSVENPDGVNPVPHPDLVLQEGDQLMLYGELRQIEGLFG